MSKQVAIVVPVFNPKADWLVVLLDRYHELKTFLNHLDFNLHIVNDGSGPVIEVSHLGATLQKYSDIFLHTYPENQGKGYALRYGIQRIQQPIIIYTDVDLPFELNSMVAVIQALQEHDVAVGVKDDSYYSKLPLQRRLISKTLQRLIRFGYPKLLTSDTQCGLKGMNAAGKTVFLKTQTNRYLFDLEFIFMLSRTNLKQCTVPVKLRPGVVFSQMNTRVLLQELNNFFRILRKGAKD